MDYKGKRILLLTSHPDDVEFGMGGTLNRLIKESEHVKSVIFANCEEQPGNEGILNELKDSMSCYKIHDYEVLDLPNTKFPEVTDKIREKLEQIKMDYNADIVFTNSKNSIHQDHKTVALEVEKILRHSTILSFEDIKSCPQFFPAIYFSLDKEDLDKKIEGLNCYKTQYRRKYHDEELIRSLAKFRGGQIGKDYAESFEIIRMIV